jgi:hypothetical protein
MRERQGYQSGRFGPTADTKTSCSGRRAPAPFGEDSESRNPTADRYSRMDKPRSGKNSGFHSLWRRASGRRGRQLCMTRQRLKRSRTSWLAAICMLGASLLSLTSLAQPVSAVPPARLIEGFDATPAPNLSRPPLNVPFTDPVYGATVDRATAPSQVTDRDGPAWIRHEYSRKQVFNADSTKALTISSNGWIRLYKVNADGTMTFAKTLNLAEPQEPQWHATDPNLINFFGPYGDGMAINTYDIRTDQKTVTRSLADRMRALFGTTAAHAWTKQEGRPSDDGRIWCLQVETTTFDMLGLVAYDAVTDQILGHLATTIKPDHVSTSPKGNYCVPSWVDGFGTRAYSLDFSRFQQLHTTSEHSDLTVASDGRETYVFTDYNTGDVAMVDLATSVRTNLFRLYGANSSGTAMHISGTARNVPGFVLVSTYLCTENYGAAPCADTQWFKNKLFAIELKANPRIINIAHSHYGNADYFSEPQATVNADFTKILFTSTWESTAPTDIADYLVTLPAGAVALGTPLNPAPTVPPSSSTTPPSTPSTPSSTPSSAPSTTPSTTTVSVPPSTTAVANTTPGPSTPPTTAQPATGSTNQAFVATLPVRILESRPTATPTFDLRASRIGRRDAGTITEVPVLGRAGVPTASGAVAINVTVTEPTASGYVTAFSCGQPVPTASNLNFAPGQTIANFVVAKPGANGSVCLYTSAATHLLADLTGYYPATSRFKPLNPQRLLDSRPSSPRTVDGIGSGIGIRSVGSITSFPVVGRVGLSGGLTAVALNVTVTSPQQDGYLSVFPCGQNVPNTSSLNFGTGQTVANAVVSNVGADGNVCVYTNVATHLIIDINAAYPVDSYFIPYGPVRILESRPGATPTVDRLQSGIGIRPAGSITRVPVAGRVGIRPNGGALALNVTVTEPTSTGFITVYPCGQPAPNASTLNFIRGQTVANSTISKLGPDGDICIYTSAPTQLIIDINGGFI